MWKDRVRPFVRPLPQWSPVALPSASRLVTATLHWDGETADVTTDHTVASLNPLVIATSLDAGERAVLEYRDSSAGRLLGLLCLTRDVSIVHAAAAVSFYRVEAGEHYCLRWPLRAWNAWLQNRSMSRHAASAYFNMTPTAAQQLMIAYLCPRPVVLVSVESVGHCNIFPMDLIGPLERCGLYSLALRSTNASEPIMRKVGRVALSHVPAAMKPLVYKLAAHHKQPPQDWSALSFPLRPSSTFHIPIVAEALRVQELSIVHSQAIGLHTLFLTRVVSTEEMAKGPQLHHTAGFYQAYRRAHGAALLQIDGRDV